MNNLTIAIIGGGAAGFFAAIQAKTNHPKAHVVLFEKTRKLLAKVKISGGGRCNVTNGTTSLKTLAQGYPRGAKQLKNAFRVFNNQHTQDWFRSRGVALKTEADGRVFPVSNRSQSIIDCLMNEAEKIGLLIELGLGVSAIEPKPDERLILSFGKKTYPINVFDKVIVATGGSPKRQGLEWLATLGHQIEHPVPSLFTFNMPNNPITELMGVVAPTALIRIQGTKLQSVGPLLLTHWGMSGPAILKLSSLGARVLSEQQYCFNAQVNWVNVPNDQDIAMELKAIIRKHPKKKLANVKPYDLPQRLWHYLLEQSHLSPQKPWSELGKKGLNKLVQLLSNDVYQVRGKTTFKEEFVTCGGVSLKSVHFKTMQSKVCPNLYFAGEVIDVDGITGGYNFQSAWTTGFIAGKLL